MKRRAPAAGHRPPSRRAGGPVGEDRFAPAYQLVDLRVPDRPLRARADPTAAHPDGRRPMTFASRARRGPPRRWLRRFVRAYGWRAYALPVLTVLTLLCGVDVANGSAGGMPLLGSPGAPEPPAAGPEASGGSEASGASEPAAADPAPGPTPTGIFVDDPGGGMTRPLPPTALPPGAAYSQRGTGRFVVVPGASPVVGGGPLKRYAVEVEGGVAADGQAFAAAVQRTLGSARSWGADGRMSFQRVDGGAVDFRVSLTSALTVRSLCGYTLPFETSCYNGELGRAVINHARWVRGAVAYAGELEKYRLYVVNHEVGHALGYEHAPCPRDGGLAPVMMQQTLGLQTAGVGSCRPNPWPHP